MSKLRLTSTAKSTPEYRTNFFFLEHEAADGKELDMTDDRAIRELFNIAGKSVQKRVP